MRIVLAGIVATLLGSCVTPKNCTVCMVRHQERGEICITTQDCRHPATERCYSYEQFQSMLDDAESADAKASPYTY